MTKKKIHIGTSGWHYKHWADNFYPNDIKDADQLDFYIKHFSTVELNNSFYHLPEAKTFKNWKNAVPENFLFAVKASRYITHMKKLKVGKIEINRFVSRANKLEVKLGPILFQLPPKWKVNLERLETFLSKLPEGYNYVFECRNPTWYNEEVYALLEQYNCAFCIYQLAGHFSPEKVTANFVYIRLHGPGDKYQGSYPEKTLKEWASKCKQWQKGKKEVYIYFDNDQFGYAAFNAASLKQLVETK
jgi:uncharacterized protein YecE (DUF72 family)